MHSESTISDTSETIASPKFNAFSSKHKVVTPPLSPPPKVYRNSKYLNIKFCLKDRFKITALDDDQTYTKEETNELHYKIRNNLLLKLQLLLLYVLQPIWKHYIILTNISFTICRGLAGKMM